MRAIRDHAINGLNEAIQVEAIDGPGPGGASHHYRLTCPPVPDGAAVSDEIRFQRGPIGEAGVNGVSNEAVLAVLIDRLRGFQSGKFACRENAEALACLENALYYLKARTVSRLARGVEGTMEL